MPKLEYNDTHHVPRKNFGKKNKNKGLGEDVQDKRIQRINFKNYIRQLEEDLGDEDSVEEWVVERCVDLNEGLWTEVATFTDEQEAQDAADDYQDQDALDTYRVRQL